jgi:putative Holliday junction resolvase
MMARIMAMDFGLKRTGLAVTDPLQLIAGGLATVETRKLMEYLQQYFKAEAVERVIIGDPRNHDGSDTHATKPVAYFMEAFCKKFPNMPLTPVDERFTSKMARKSMMEMGLSRKKRQNKGLVDEISAIMMLQEYMEAQNR